MSSHIHTLNQPLSSLKKDVLGLVDAGGKPPLPPASGWMRFIRARWASRTVCSLAPG